MIDFMLDGGHDMFTNGKGVPSMKEFEFNRAVVLKIQELLKQYENVNTHLSHDLFDGIDTSLKARTDLANKLKVKAFISVHADAFSNASAKGETVFIYAKAGNSTLALANAINNELKADMSITNRGVKRADFHVLRETAMDAILIEFGFMTNPEDLALLKSEAYRTKCAEMVVTALVKHYGLKKKVVAQPVQQTTVTPDSQIPFKVIVPNTAYWQTVVLVKEYTSKGYKSYGQTASILGTPATPKDSDPLPFVIETNYAEAKLLVKELQDKGYKLAYGERI